MSQESRAKVRLKNKTEVKGFISKMELVRTDGQEDGQVTTVSYPDGEDRWTQFIQGRNWDRRGAWAVIVFAYQEPTFTLRHRQKHRQQPGSKTLVVTVYGLMALNPLAPENNGLSMLALVNCASVLGLLKVLISF